MKNLLLALFAAVFAISCSDDDSTGPSGNGEYAEWLYMSGRKSSDDRARYIYRINVKSGELEKVLDGAEMDSQPANGKMAYTRDMENDDERALCVANTNGSGEIVIEISDIINAYLSPTADKVLYEIYNDNFELELHYASIDGSFKTKISEYEISEYSFISPDGSKIAYAIDNFNKTDIYVYDFASHQSTLLTSDSSYADVHRIGCEYVQWSEAGDKIFYILEYYEGDYSYQTSRLFSCSPDGSNKTQIAEIYGMRLAADFDGGTKFIYSARDENYYMSLWTMGVDGSNQTKITPEGEYWITIPGWPRPGKDELLVGTNYEINDEDTGDLIAINLKTGDVRNIVVNVVEKLKAIE